MAISAREFMDQYREMSVRLDRDRADVVDVHRYLINRIDSSHNAEHAKATWHKISTAINKRIQEANRHLQAPGRHRQAVGAGHGHAGRPSVHGGRHLVLSPRARTNPATAQQARMTRNRLIAELDLGVTYGQLSAVPLGKGSPAAIAVYLRLADRYGLAPQGLQAFADTRDVGLDCSGFVTNYFVARGLMTSADVVNRNAASFDQPQRRRSTLQDVRRGDVMVWADHSHVAVIDSVPQRHVVPDRQSQHGRHHGAPHGAGPHHGHSTTQPDGQVAPGPSRCQFYFRARLSDIRRKLTDFGDWRLHLTDGGPQEPGVSGLVNFHSLGSQSWASTREP
jgi:hypothetical protein